MSIFGTIGGLGLGTLVGWSLIGALAASGSRFDTFAMPTTALATVLVVSILTGVTAVARPARRAAKLYVLKAIAID